MSRSSIAPRDLAALILAATCWGVGTVISKAALAEVSPFTLLPIQLAASLAVLAVLMRRQGISAEPRVAPARAVIHNRVSARRLGLDSITPACVLLWAQAADDLFWQPGSCASDPPRCRLVAHRAAGYVRHRVTRGERR
jgi:drug/metabolite transporter (DMT)-like permease